MTEITFEIRDGSSRVCTGSDGQTLMVVATANGVPGIVGECGGEMSCATCHVHIIGQGVALFGAPTSDELDLLEVVDDFTESSRLGCQLRLRPDTADFTVSVP